MVEAGEGWLLVQPGPDRNPVRVEVSSLARLDVHRGRRTLAKEGAILGLIPGAVVGGLLGAYGACDDQGPGCNPLGGALLGALAVGGATAGAGALIGASPSRPTGGRGSRSGTSASPWHRPELAKLAACLVEAEGVVERARIVEGDIFKEDFGGASVVTMYLLPHLNLCVRHRLLAMEPGTHVVSHQFSMAEWDPDESATVEGRNVYLWVVPARVDGVWDFRDRQGKTFSIELRQTFGKLGGEITRGRVREPLLSASVRGRDLRFTFDTAVSFEGTVRGDEIAGTLSTDGARVAVEAVGSSAAPSGPRPGPRCLRTAAATTAGSRSPGLVRPSLDGPECAASEPHGRLELRPAGSWRPQTCPNRSVSSLAYETGVWLLRRL